MKLRGYIRKARANGTSDGTDENPLKYEEIVAEHGEWTAMAVDLGDGRSTRPPAADWRLRRIVQVATDLLGKPLSEARVLDLACLEGHYGLEFAMHGATVVGIEVRESNIIKARYAQQELRLKNIRFIQDDVRNLSRAQLGGFDIVICSGILYHLDVPDVFDFVRRMHDICDRLVVIDTQIALKARASVSDGGHTYYGLRYKEHDERADRETKYKDLWSSVDNVESFWFTHPSLCNLIADTGFTSMLRVEDPGMPETGIDRQTYVAVKSRPAKILSSHLTNELKQSHQPELNDAPTNTIQLDHGPMFRFLKAALPQPVKNRIKPILRSARLLPADSTPEFMKRPREQRS
jgi:2-polyprenyl-3-methyl-5-hydroxy-6-metoxy-1,4-benzoquinol methylase